MDTTNKKHLIIYTCIYVLWACSGAASEPTTLEVDPSEKKQIFEGMGCGTIFYSGHITSFGQRKKYKIQEQFYDDLFKAVQTHYLHLMIRPDFEPENDNKNAFHDVFPETAFKKNIPALEVCIAAKKRNPDIKLFATLYTPPPWMKSNNEASGGGKEKATLKSGLEQELGEYIWAYLRHMKKNGQPIDYLSICNESDWAHTQPGYFLTPKQHAVLIKKLIDHMDKMAKRYPDIPVPKIVAPNMLSAVDTAKKYWPAMDKETIDRIDILGSHDYDRRGHRWKKLRQLAGSRPLWGTEWCWNGKDTSPDLIKSASEFWLVMTEAFNDGVNVWMAYDWAYPPRQGGEALTHVQWGKSYHKTKIYYGFQQWCNTLMVGMRIVKIELSGPDASGISKPGVKASAFIEENNDQLVIHVVNVQDRPASILTRITQSAFINTHVETYRTSSDDANKKYPITHMPKDGLPDTLKPREMVTYVIIP